MYRFSFILLPFLSSHTVHCLSNSIFTLLCSHAPFFIFSFSLFLSSSIIYTFIRVVFFAPLFFSLSLIHRPPSFDHFFSSLIHNPVVFSSHVTVLWSFLLFSHPPSCGLLFSSLIHRPVVSLCQDSVSGGVASPSSAPSPAPRRWSRATSNVWITEDVRGGREGKSGREKGEGWKKWGWVEVEEVKDEEMF